MPVELDHDVPLGQERYRFHPWRARPLSMRALRRCWLGVIGLAIAIDVGAVAGLVLLREWVALLLALVWLGLALYTAVDGWSELRSPGPGFPAWLEEAELPPYLLVDEDEFDEGGVR